MMESADFWCHLDRLVANSAVRIDRPAGSAHPRYPSFIYPFDYGYLGGTASADGSGLDVWIGSLPDRAVTAVLCAVDLEKRDAELKILLGCTPEEAQQIVAFHNKGAQGAILIQRPG
jgi:inorganic pyrophosphatase